VKYYYQSTCYKQYFRARVKSVRVGSWIYSKGSDSTEWSHSSGIQLTKRAQQRKFNDWTFSSWGD